MGYAVSWVAVRSSGEAVLEELGLARTDETEEIPESPLCFMESGGWSIVFSNRMDTLPEKALATLSRDTEVVTCAVEEHVMFSQSEYWRNGSRVFQATHESEKGIYHLAIEGQAPVQLTELHEQAKALQDREGGVKASVDHIFSVPVDFCEELTGFTYNSSSDDDVWVVLQEVGAASSLRPTGCTSVVAVLLLLALWSWA